MVDKKQDPDIEIDVTNEENSDTEELELEEIEGRKDDKIKQLRHKLEAAEEEKRQSQDELQRAKADFLNAKRRIEEERSNDRLRNQKQHIEELLPLCDSFHMAISNKEAWEKADKSWRVGIEGIYAQLMRILKDAGVEVIDPTGEPFDPTKHEAVGTEPVNDKKLEDTVVSVLQYGYEITLDGKTELIRPARVTTASYTN